MARRPPAFACALQGTLDLRNKQSDLAVLPPFFSAIQFNEFSVMGSLWRKPSAAWMLSEEPTWMYLRRVFGISRYNAEFCGKIPKNEGIPHKLMTQHKTYWSRKTHRT